MNKYDLVMFDFDGTVCSTQLAIAHCVKRTFITLNKPLPNEEAIYTVVSQGITMQETFSKLSTNAETLEQNDLEEWVKLYRAIYLKEGLEKTKLYEGANEIFSQLYDLNIPIVIVSNKGEAAIEAALNYFNLAQHIALSIGDRPNIKKKPDQMVFDVIIKPQFNLGSEKILMIGDTAIDLQFARNIKSHSCWASYGYGDYEECVSMKPTYTINNLSELKSIFIN